MKKNALFSCSPLCECDLQDIGYFYIANKDACGLETYIKEFAYDDEKDRKSRTYIIRDIRTNELVGYFSLKAMSVIVNDTIFRHDTLPAIELADFAVNDAYREQHMNMKYIGQIIFLDFVLPIAYEASNIIGAMALCVYALPYKNLINYYKRIGFMRLDAKTERRLHRRIKPRYDRGCIFMYQSL